MLQPGGELRDDPWGPSQLLEHASVNTDVCQHLGSSKLLKNLERHWTILDKKGQKNDAVREESVCEIS